MKNNITKGFILLIAMTIFLSTVTNHVGYAIGEYESTDIEQLIEEEYSNVSIEKDNYNIYDNTQELQLEVDNELDIQASIDLDYTESKGFISGSWIDEDGIEQQGNYEIIIEEEDWILVDPITNETFKISDTEISASAWWVPVLILVARVGKVASKLKKADIDKAMKMIPKNTALMNDKRLKKIVGDVHAFKGEYVPKGTPVSHFNVYKDKDTGRLWLFENKGKKRKIPTYEFDK